MDHGSSKANGRNLAYERQRPSRLEGRITVEETLLAIRSIGPGKSAGPDGIPAEVYKAHIKLVAPILTDLYNQTFETGLIP